METNEIFDNRNGKYYRYLERVDILFLFCRKLIENEEFYFRKKSLIDDD